MNEKKMYDIGWYSAAACDHVAPKGRTKCHLLPAEKTPLFSKDEDYILKVVDKFEFKCPRSSKFVDGPIEDRKVIVHDDMRCSVDSVDKPSLLSCKCGKEIVVPSVNVEIGNEIKRIDVMGDAYSGYSYTGKMQKQKTVVITNMGSDVEIRQTKDGHEIKTRDHQFKIGKNTKVTVGTCGAKAEFENAWRRPDATEILLAPIDFALWIAAKISKQSTSGFPRHNYHSIHMRPSVYLPGTIEERFIGGKAAGIACAFIFDEIKGSDDMWKVKNKLERVECFGSHPSCLDKAIRSYENSGEVYDEKTKSTGRKKWVNFILPSDKPIHGSEK